MAEDEKEAAPRKATTRKSSAKKRRTTKRRTAPPNNVTPGAVHKAVAAFLLDGLSQRTAAKVGAPLSVGDLSEADSALLRSTGATDEDGNEPVELLARILAHLGHRIPFFSKVEKRLEGQDAKSGLASDLIALLMQLWHRNRHLAPVVMQAAQARTTPTQEWSPTPDTGGTGATVPTPGMDIPNNQMEVQ